MVLLVPQISEIFELTPRLRMFVVRHSSEGTERHRLEVTVSTLGWIVHMCFFVVMPSSPHLILILRIMHRLLHMIFIDHLSLIIYLSFIILPLYI